MNKDVVQLTDDLAVSMYPFSEYITCVEVLHHGQVINTFCTDVELVEEWKEQPDVLLELCQAQLSQGDSVKANSKRHILSDSLEVEYFPFSSDVYCVNVYKYGQFVNSLCTDRASFEEWREEEDLFISIVEQML